MSRRASTLIAVGAAAQRQREETLDSGPAGNSQMLRERVLTSLEHFWSPLRVDDELRPYLAGVWGQPVAADALARLLADERAAFDRDEPQGVWVGLGVYPDGRGDPERWVRSDWPLWVRVVDPDGERVRRYWLLRQLYRAPVKPGGPGTEPLTDLWERLAADLPAREVAQLRRHVPEDLGRSVDWDRDRFSIWGEVADWQFDLLAGEDRHRRERIAERLAPLSPTAQLFGRDPGS
jgi:hypothetical protein